MTQATSPLIHANNEIASIRTMGAPVFLQIYSCNRMTIPFQRFGLFHITGYRLTPVEPKFVNEIRYLEDLPFQSFSCSSNCISPQELRASLRSICLRNACWIILINVASIRHRINFSNHSSRTERYRHSTLSESHKE